MEQQKKKRGENWSSEERDILRQLISQSAHIIEDKSTKTSTNILKTKEWKNISIKFNEITGKHRSDGELKLAWKRMKLTAKFNISAHRRELTMTGGGEKPPSPSAEDMQIMAIAPHDFVNEVNEYDSDAVIPVTMATNTKIMFVADPKPGPSSEGTGETIVINEENPEQIIVGVKGISNDTSRNTESAKMVLISSNETINKRSPVKRKKKILQNQNSTAETRVSILQSNTDFKKRQLEMLEVEHKLNIKIAELKIKKLELEIAELECNKKDNTEQ